MPNYRRAFVPGGTFFFTLVTFGRRPFLTGERARGILRAAIEGCRADLPFTLEAMVLLPDHLHAVWTLPAGDADFSKRWAKIKRQFTAAWLSGDSAENVHAGDAVRWQRRRSVWQPRFMEHAIRDFDDWAKHLDYLHWNPVKHGYVKCPHAWPWSTFHRLVRENVYPADWRCVCGGKTAHVPDDSWADGLE